MAEAFDPYLRWLGIRDPQRPPNHYRLLGLDLFESDPDVIAVAADRQMGHVRTFQSGQYSAVSQRLLNELAAARVCLLKDDRKKAYDEQLRRRIIALQGVAATRQPANRVIAPNADGAPVPAQVAQVMSSPLDLRGVPAIESPPTAWKSKRKTNSKKILLWIGAPIATLGMAVGVAIYVANRDGSATANGDHTTVASDTGARDDGRGTKASHDIGNAVVTNRADKGSGIANPSGAANPNGAAAANSAESPNMVPGGNGPKPLIPASSDSSSPLAPRPSPLSSAPSPRPPAPSPPQPPPAVAPPQPPIESPHDVLRVVNPAQPVAPDAGFGPKPSLQVAQADGGKPSATGGHDKSGNAQDGHDKGAGGAPKNSAAMADIDGNSKPKAPVPSKEQIAAVEAKIQKLFNIAAAKKPQERSALAKTLYDQGIDTNNEEVDRYVLLSTAMKDAAILGDASLALKAANKLADAFAVNPIGEKFGVLSTLSKTVRTPTAAQSLFDNAQSLLDEALAADDFDAAKSVAQLAASLATKTSDAPLAKQLRQLPAEVEQVKKEYVKAATARDALQSLPDDPAANFVWGFYLGPIKGDFDLGLPYLAKGSEKVPAELAKQELAEPTDPKAQAALADGWLEFSANQREPARAHLRSHAAEWYSQAVGRLTGLERKRVEDQLVRLKAEGRTSLVSKNFIRYLTDGSWVISWLANPKSSNPEAHRAIPFYPITFHPDGTCQNQYFKGTWSQQGSNSVIVRYPTRPNYLQRYVLTKQGTLSCEHYEPPDQLQLTGEGVKKSPSAN